MDSNKYDSSDSDSDSGSESSDREINNNNQIVQNNLIPDDAIDDDEYFFENNVPDEEWDEEEREQYEKYLEAKKIEYDILQNHLNSNIEKDFGSLVVEKKKERNRTQKEKSYIDMADLCKSDDEEDNKKKTWKSEKAERSKKSLGLPVKTKCPYRFQFKSPRWSKEISDMIRDSKKVNTSVFQLDDCSFPTLNK